MGCGSSTASAPGKFADDPDFTADGGRKKYNKKTGEAVECDGGKDDDGREDVLFEVEEATGEQFMSVRPWLGQIIEPDVVEVQLDTNPSGLEIRVDGEMVPTPVTVTAWRRQVCHAERLVDARGAPTRIPPISGPSS